MSDNVTLNLGGGGDIIAADDIGGVKHQRIKLVYGPDGGITGGDVTTSNPYPVQLGPDVLNALAKAIANALNELFGTSFGRLRTSLSRIGFESQFAADARVLDWATVASFPFLPGNVREVAPPPHLPAEAGVLLTTFPYGTTSLTRVTRRHFRPQLGRAQTVFAGALFGAPTSTITKRVGWYSAAAGTFFEQTSTGMFAVSRSSASGSPVDTRVGQASWNLDKVDGTGESEVTIDFSKVQVYCVELQGGRQRLGVVAPDGDLIIWVHRFVPLNIGTQGLGMLTLPIAYEISSSVAFPGVPPATEFKQYQVMLLYEGSALDDLYDRIAAAASTSISIPGAGEYIVCAVRLAATPQGFITSLFPQQVEVTVGSSSPLEGRSNGVWKLYLGGEIFGRTNTDSTTSVPSYALVTDATATLTNPGSCFLAGVPQGGLFSYPLILIASGVISGDVVGGRDVSQLVRHVAATIGVSALVGAYAPPLTLTVSVGSSITSASGHIVFREL